MWSDLRTYTAGFPNAVITGVDSEGYPFSVRCQPVFDDAARVLRLAPFAHVGIQPGQAGMLFHSHDEELGNLKMFHVSGRLECAYQGWVFHPERLIVGGSQNPLQMIQLILRARRSAKQYLAKRNLARPQIPWERIRSLYSAEAPAAATPHASINT